jgi:hypothetical protein
MITASPAARLTSATAPKPDWRSCGGMPSPTRLSCCRLLGLMNSPELLLPTMPASPCACRAVSSRACATVTPAIRCCCRCCRSWPTAREVSGFTTDAVGDLDSRAAHGAAAQISRPRPADRQRQLRDQLPLLLPPAFSLRRGNGGRRPVAAGAGHLRQRHLDHAS